MNRKRLIAAALTAALCLCGCSEKSSAGDSSSRVTKDSILKIDGTEVPFEDGEEAVADALGESYCQWLDFSYPKGTKFEKVALKLAMVEEREDEHSTIYSYIFNDSEGDLSLHDIEFLGYEGVDIPIDYLEKEYGDCLITDSVSDYELFVIDGHIAGRGSSDGDIDLIIDMFRSEDNRTEDVIFTVIDRHE
ncbi:MAG: hypothetical protein IJ555_11055 [Ruminococcus sp.]|nr:hypothetical protein [Ruminococcus sp.]MBR1864341.1 hypothetical protein [Ruminococcus sp.]